MKIYNIRWYPKAKQDLKEIPARYRLRAVHLIDGLADEPYPTRSKQLRDPLGHLYRVPLDKWRILYDVDEANKEVWVFRILEKTGPETYEGLDA